MTRGTCPKCGAPCQLSVLIRGGDHGWGTTELERTVYTYNDEGREVVGYQVRINSKDTPEGEDLWSRWRAVDDEAVLTIWQHRVKQVPWMYQIRELIVKEQP